MKKKVAQAMAGVLVGLGVSAGAQAAYIGTTGLSAVDMANVLLASSSGITINSASYSGASGASGSFTGGGFFGINQGLVLTSGSATNISSTNNGLGGSSLLDPLTTSTTLDASVLTINFTPTGGQIGFNYVFSSREYPVYVNSSFNDVFGFFVNGINYALIPGTSTPVAINNINCGNSSNTTGPYCNLFNDNRDGSLSTGELNFDQGGWTDVFTFIAPVIAGVENTLILAIADAGDRILDSGAFIKGGSLQVCGVPGTPPCDNDVPEPASLALLGLGLAGLAGLRRRRV